MKPIVIYIDKDTKQITLSKKDFESYLEQAYNAGYAEGSKGVCITTTPYFPGSGGTTSPYTPYSPITCSTINGSSADVRIKGDINNKDENY